MHFQSSERNQLTSEYLNTLDHDRIIEIALMLAEDAIELSDAQNQYIESSTILASKLSS